jgi:nicotinamide mononucleotide transporter
MNPIFDWLFAQYENTPTYLVVLELIGIFFAVLSVLFAKEDNILVFPTGIVSTAIFVYILIVYSLLGDMIINAYYFVMSIYGWYIWTRKIDAIHFTPISVTSGKEWRYTLFIFVAALVFIYGVYMSFNMWNNWTAYVDTLTTGIFFAGMWLMARKKIENWILWIAGDLISIPLYLYKGLVFTSFLYLFLTIIAVFGYFAWKKRLNKELQTA